MTNYFTSKLFLDSLSNYSQTSLTISHPTFGDFQLLKNTNNDKLLKKTLTKEQADHLESGFLSKYQSLNSPNILQFKGVVQEQSSQYTLYCESFDMTVKEEVEAKALENTRFTQEQILHFLQNTSSALSEMQKNKFIHGELKSNHIVKVGQDYKVLHPKLFGKVPIGPKENTPTFSLKNTTRIISPEILNALHREVVDPVNEDYKDDVYALGLIVLDMMNLRVEAPIPIEKKLERANFFYSNTLLRLVKKMLENVLTLRLDPIACNLYVEKIYTKTKLSPGRSSLRNSRNTLANMLDNLTEDNDDLCVYKLNSTEKSYSISQQPSPLTGRNTYSETLSGRQRPLTPSPIRNKITEVHSSLPTFGDEEVKEQKECKIRLLTPEAQPHFTFEKEKAEEYAQWEKDYLQSYLPKGGKGMNGSHMRKSSATFSKAPTNATFTTPRYSAREPLAEGSLNLEGVLDLSSSKLSDENFFMEQGKFSINDTQRFSGLPSSNSLEDEDEQNSARKDWKRPTGKKLKIVIPKGTNKQEVSSLQKILNSQRNEETPEFRESMGPKESGLSVNANSTSVKYSMIKKLNLNDLVSRTNSSKDNSVLMSSERGYSQYSDVMRKGDFKIFDPTNGNRPSRRGSIFDVDAQNEEEVKMQKTIRENVAKCIRLSKAKTEGKSQKSGQYGVLGIFGKCLGTKNTSDQNQTTNSIPKERHAISSKLCCMRAPKVHYEEEETITVYPNALDRKESERFSKAYIRQLISDDPVPVQPEDKIQKVVEDLGDGSFYEGEVLDSQRHGKGKLIYPDGKYYEGTWQNGEIYGYGTLFSADGFVIYQGDWEDSKYTGHGILKNHWSVDIAMTARDRPIIYDKQVGAWKEFRGSFEGGKWNGKGELLFVNGDKFVGKFKEDKIHGEGVYKSQDGRMWKGKWEENFFIY